MLLTHVTMHKARIIAVAASFAIAHVLYLYAQIPVMTCLCVHALFFLSFYKKKTSLATM